MTVDNQITFIKGMVYFCHRESINVKLASNHTKIRIESYITGKGTSTRFHFEGSIEFGDYKEITLEVLSCKPVKFEVENRIPLLLLLSKSMPFGIFIPKETGNR